MAAPLSVNFLPEPLLEFCHGQLAEHPKDGLFLFGPVDDDQKPSEMRYGVIGTKDGIGRFDRWAQRVRGYIPPFAPNKAHHAAFPGFEATFKTRWPEKPVATIHIAATKLAEAIRRSNRHDAVKTAVDLYAKALSDHFREEETRPPLWFVVVPEDVYRYGRKESIVPKGEKVQSPQLMKAKTAKKFLTEPALFKDMMDEADLYRYEVNFHNQLKARLLGEAKIQIVRETTLAPEDFQNDAGRPQRNVQDPATVAWNLCTTAYFKAEGKPWRLAAARPGVCYVGLVFKRDETDPGAGNACCGAQLFLNSGDGVVFKGAVGPWYSPSRKEFHLPREKAFELMDLVVRAYEKEHNCPPSEIFIHGRAEFDDEEWEGFKKAVPASTKVIGIRIKKTDELKLYTPGKHPPLRGTYYQVHPRLGYLWTKGYIPRLCTYPGWEVPNPIAVYIDRGEADLRQVLADILALTKVNYNACIFADGMPVTLRFADSVGEILTAAPGAKDAPLPFSYYI